MSEMNGRLPNFLIIGAPKSGTTSLSRYLQHHPDVFIPTQEELNYFAFRNSPPHYTSPDAARILRTTRCTASEYRRQFAQWQQQKMAGEKSALYLSAEAAPAAIYEEIPNAKLIVILRNPADRAFSHFTHNLRLLSEPLTDFRDALAAETERKKNGWSYCFWYRERGRYVSQLQRYLALFPREQLLILLFDDLRADAEALMRGVCRFLGIDERHDMQVHKRYNVSEGVPRNGPLHLALTEDSRAKSLFKAIAPPVVQQRIWWFLYRRNLAPLPTFDPALRRQLLTEFDDEITDLERLIDRDLSAWRNR